jgi:HicA toxin of bacterial toxin-antitoxin,
MSPKLPVLSGDDLVKTLERFGYAIARQKGSHIRLRHPTNGEFFFREPCGYWMRSSDSTRPSRMWMMRWAWAATSRSCVMMMIVLPCW